MTEHIYKLSDGCSVKVVKVGAVTACSLILPEEEKPKKKRRVKASLPG